MSVLKLDARGRLVIPVHLRSIVLERRENPVKRLQARFAHIPGNVSLVDELKAERRGR